MDVWPGLAVLAESGCRYVVVGSAARALAGHMMGKFGPRDLDIVVADTDDDRARVAAALARIGGRMVVGGRRREVAAFAGSTWAVVTPYGPVDVFFRFADGSDYFGHRRAAWLVPIGGIAVRCHPMRHAA